MEQQDYLLFLICSIQKRRHELTVLETAGLLCKTMSCGSWTRSKITGMNGRLCREKNYASAGSSPDREVLTSFPGQPSLQKTDGLLQAERLSGGEKVLLCSDGFC